MSKWFCATPAVDAVVKIAAFDAGYLMAKNNPVMAAAALPVAKGIMTVIDGGGTKEAMNAVFQQGVVELLGQVKDPIILASIQGVLSSISFDVNLPTPVLLDNAVIKEVVDGFVNGMAAVK